MHSAGSLISHHLLDKRDAAKHCTTEARPRLSETSRIAWNNVGRFARRETWLILEFDQRRFAQDHARAKNIECGGQALHSPFESVDSEYQRDHVTMDWFLQSIEDASRWVPLYQRLENAVRARDSRLVLPQKEIVSSKGVRVRATASQWCAAKRLLLWGIWLWENNCSKVFVAWKLCQPTGFAIMISSAGATDIGAKFAPSTPRGSETTCHAINNQLLILVNHANLFDAHYRPLDC